MNKLRLTSFLAAAAVCVSLFSACANNAEPTEAAQTAEAVTFSYPLIEDDASLSEAEKKMLSTSLVSVGNTHRLNEKLKTVTPFSRMSALQAELPTCSKKDTRTAR